MDSHNWIPIAALSVSALTLLLSTVAFKKKVGQDRMTAAEQRMERFERELQKCEIDKRELEKKVIWLTDEVMQLERRRGARPQGH